MKWIMIRRKEGEHEYPRSQVKIYGLFIFFTSNFF